MGRRRRGLRRRGGGDRRLAALIELAQPHDAEQLQDAAELSRVVPRELGDALEAVPDRVVMDVEALGGAADAQVPAT
jgi:hypothetical protein